MVVKSRGYGKTWLTALCCIAMGVLYPGSLIAVVSGTAEQATLIVKKIQDYFIRNPEIMREIQCDGHRPVQLSRNKGICTLKNGSKIESYSVGTMRGNRAKIMVIDESPEVKADDLDAVIGPVRNTKRDICHQRGIADYPSKTISITSACLKSNYFYSMFVSALRDFAKGSTGSFACALDYRSAARVGITDMEFFRKEQRKMPEAKFAMEYGSVFVGAESGSMFPYDLTEGCRTLRQVEHAQPSGSSSDYIIGVDLATSTDRKADNAVICVIKLADMENGAYLKKLVYLRSYHGKRLDALAEEVRRTFSRFPRTTRIVFDHRGLGDAFPQFLAQPWIDPESGKEYPPWTLDDERTIIHNAVPILRSVKASAQINQQLVSCLRVA
nr:MAG TPA: large terminase [Caudoviricetes sp.]